MEYYGSRAVSALGILLLAATLVVGVWGLWTFDPRGNVAWLLFVFGASMAVGGLSWASEVDKPVVLSRAAKKKMASEMERIRVEQMIIEAEREAGIR